MIQTEVVQRLVATVGGKVDGFSGKSITKDEARVHQFVKPVRSELDPLSRDNDGHSSPSESS
jgi:hypothetical protein